MNEWLLVFIWMGRLMVSGPFELDVCLDMAQRETKKNSSYEAVCVFQQYPSRRMYPDMDKDYFPMEPDKPSMETIGGKV